MAKYDKKSQDKVEKAMHEYKRGELKSSTGKKVKSKDQAVAIGLSEARREGSKAPKKSKSDSKKKSASSKPGPKKGSKAAKQGAKKAAATRSRSSYSRGSARAGAGR